MRICVLVPSRDHLLQGGVRIRYLRIEPELRRLGHELHIEPISNLAAKPKFAHDAYIVSKCYDARAVLLAHALAATARPVGVDLFDDYFSQRHDSRFAGLRHWLQAVLGAADFALCSTAPMRALAADYAPGLAVHLVSDAAEPFDPIGLRAALARKLEHAQESGVLQVAWFGIGDNPYFSVGLADLVAFGEDVARLQGRAFEVRLHVLTNRRALTAQGLALLKRLPVQYELQEWSEARERELLAASLVCFLPVSAQSFSTAKSLNRGLTALCSGAQVLSSGFPLYAPLAPFVYRDPAKLLADLERRSLALREDTVAQLARLVETTGDPVREARALADFLEGRCRHKADSPAAAQPAPAAVIHGRNTLGEVHALARHLSVLSVASPFCAADLDFGVRFAPAADAEGLEVLVARRHREQLAPDARAALVPRGKIGATAYDRLDLARLLPGFRFAAAALACSRSAAGIAASYPVVTAEIEQVLGRLFPGVQCYYSEHAALPWRVT